MHAAAVLEGGPHAQGGRRWWEVRRGSPPDVQLLQDQLGACLDNQHQRHASEIQGGQPS